MIIQNIIWFFEGAFQAALPLVIAFALLHLIYRPQK
jgi:hypothetical protein